MLEAEFLRNSSAGHMDQRDQDSLKGAGAERQQHTAPRPGGLTLVVDQWAHQASEFYPVNARCPVLCTSPRRHGHLRRHAHKRGAGVRGLLLGVLPQGPDPADPPLQTHLLLRLPGEAVPAGRSDPLRVLPAVPLDYLHPGQPDPVRGAVGQHGDLGSDRGATAAAAAAKAAAAGRGGRIGRVLEGHRGATHPITPLVCEKLRRHVVAEEAVQLRAAAGSRGRFLSPHQTRSDPIRPRRPAECGAPEVGGPRQEGGPNRPGLGFSASPKFREVFESRFVLKTRRCRKHRADCEVYICIYTPSSQ